jgi:hypothetical protein
VTMELNWYPEKRPPLYILTSKDLVFSARPIKEMVELVVQQKEAPIRIASGIKNKNWWLYKTRLYTDVEDYTPEEARVLILDYIARRNKRLERAKSRVSVIQTNVSRRKPIADDIKVFVWKRDAGRCVKCGSRERLEYDHIIPIAKGGSNTARNIQLLCERCNREKSDNLV